MAQIALKTEESAIIPEDIARSWYRKSHHHYKPSEQITRDYGEPFDRSATFGRSRRDYVPGSRVKRVLTWINNKSVTLINLRQANFIERTRSSIGQIKDPKISHVYANIVHGKKSIKDEFDASDSLRDSDSNKDTLFWWHCLQELSNFRQKLKKRVPEVPFLDIEDDMSRLDQECVGVLSENKVSAILEKYRIWPKSEFFALLMDTLQYRKDGNINYRELMNLLNWKRNLPDLPKMKQISLSSSDYVTTYGDSIGNIQTIESTKVRAAGLPSERSDLPIAMITRAGICPNKENLGDQTSVHCLISPSIFTRYGLSHIDFFKARNQEEIRSIFENVGFEFPEDSFDALWQKGLQKDCTGGVSVETFRVLLAASQFVAK